MYYIRPLLCDIITISLRLSQGFSTQCIGYITNCIGAVMQSNPIGTSTQRIDTNTRRRETVTKSLNNSEDIAEYNSHVKWV